MDDDELCYTSALDLGARLQSRDLSSVELTEAVLARIDQVNPKLNAYLTITPDLAMDQARASDRRALRGERIGPLDGIPCSIKDLEPCASVRTTYGSPWFRDNISENDGLVAERLKAGGCVIVGKTNTPAFGHKDMCDNLLGSPCVNPWNAMRTSGGSSGGAGAAVAAGLGPIAQGSDAGGSIRIPAALCGVVGMKPSQGRVPLHPGVDYWGRTHIGPIARTVRDAALLLSILAGRDERDPTSIDEGPADYLAACEGDVRGLRVAYSPDLGYVSVDPEVAQIVESAVGTFSDFGCHMWGLAPNWADPGPAHKVMFDVLQAARFGDLLDERPEWVDQSHREMIERGRNVSAVDHMKAVLMRSRLYDQVHEFFQRHDLLLTPAMPLAAWPATPNASHEEQDPRFATVYDRIEFMVPFNLAGLPAISVPCGFTAAGLPVGLQIVGPWHDDARVLRAAATFESHTSWSARRPPLAWRHGTEAESLRQPGS